MVKFRLFFAVFNIYTRVAYHMFSWRKRERKRFSLAFYPMYLDTYDANPMTLQCWSSNGSCILQCLLWLSSLSLYLYLRETLRFSEYEQFLRSQRPSRVGSARRSVRLARAASVAACLSGAASEFDIPRACLAMLVLGNSPWLARAGAGGWSVCAGGRRFCTCICAGGRAEILYMCQLV